MESRVGTTDLPANEVSFNKLRSYALTISDNEKGIDTTKESLQYAMQTLEQYCEDYLHYKVFTIIDPVYEVKPRTGHLHVHAMVLCSHAIRYKDTKCKGMQYYWRELKTKADARRWHRYRHKHTQEENDQDYLLAQLNRRCRLIS